MAGKSRKDIVLKAMRTILQEYKERTHTTKITKCSLCKIFRNTDKFLCGKCPMTIFDDNIVPCMDRKCKPVDCKSSNWLVNEIEIKRVIEFYKQAIKKIELMTNQEFLKTDFQFLIEIDNKVFYKFNKNFKL